MAKPRSPLRNWAEYAAVRALLAAGTAYPIRWNARLRSTGIENLAQAGLPASTLDGVYATLDRMVETFAKLPQINAENVRKTIDYDGFGCYLEAKKRGRGVLFATAHLGNWELSAYAHALMAEPMNVVVRPLDNPILDQFVERRRAGSGNRILGKSDYLRRAVEALQRNEAVGVLIDQDAGPDGVFVDFFGRKASATPIFAKLAHRTGAAIIPGFALWIAEERRYVLRFSPIVETTGDAARDTQTLHTILEGAIRQYPDQWMWLHRRWKTRPPDETAS
ncbi:MAG: lysophospholipid acyltransferase family protein [Bryobacteraceae bacterium]|nr:lysophospholipid acyltransferase family protein [Bryobacteraceae bacterium]